MMKPDPRLCIRRSGGGWVVATPAGRAGPVAVEEILEELLERRAGREHRNFRPGAGPPARACAAWVDEMLTTAGSSFAARSAKLSGAALA